MMIAIYGFVNPPSHFPSLDRVQSTEPKLAARKIVILNDSSLGRWVDSCVRSSAVGKMARRRSADSETDDLHVYTLAPALDQMNRDRLPLDHQYLLVRPQSRQFPAPCHCEAHPGAASLRPRLP